MSKKLIKRFLPDPKKIKDNKSLKIFGKFIHDSNLWHLNRYSAATAFSIGLFVCYIPLPGHMITAAFLAILFRANLPVSVALVWFSNPFTYLPMYYLAYKLGALLLQLPPEKFQFEMSWHWLSHELYHYFPPLLLGSLICGTVLAILGNLGIRLWWRYAASKAWKERAGKRKN